MFSSLIAPLKYFLKYKKNLIHFTVAGVIILLIIDGLMIRLVPFNDAYSNIGTRELIFIGLFAILSIAQITLLNYPLSVTFYASKSLRIIRQALHACQYTQLVLLSGLVIQVIFLSRVYTNLLIILATLSYGLSFIIFVILSCYFWRWYSMNRNTVVFAYAVCCTALSFNILVSILFVDLLLQQRHEILYPQMGLTDIFIGSDSIIMTLRYLFISSSILAFTASWGSSVVLLYHYSTRRGRAKSWILLGLPLVFFLSQFMVPLFSYFLTMFGQNPVSVGGFLTIFYALSRPIGGILFGIAFWIISRYIRKNSSVRDYLISSAYGFMLLFVSNQVILLTITNYPPFGIITITFMPIASYLVFFGIYSLAISVSQDMTLRKSIKNSVEKELHFVGSIGAAQMNRQIQVKVLNITKKLSSDIHKETGIVNSLSDEDINLYIKEALSARLANLETKRKDPHV